MWAALYNIKSIFKLHGSEYLVRVEDLEILVKILTQS